MEGLRVWLRPPRNLLILFLAIVVLPAATLVVLGVRLLEQDRALVRQRRAEILEGAGDRVVRVLEQDLAIMRQQLARQPWTASQVPADSVHVVWRSDRIEASPPGRLPYYPFGRVLKELPTEAFGELEQHEFRAQNLTEALKISRQLAASQDDGVRAGALLRQARILRKMGRQDEALRTYRSLSQFSSLSIGGIPADLVARRARCVLLEEQSRTHELREEALAIHRDLRSGRWQLDRPSYLYIAEQLSQWIGSQGGQVAEYEALAAAVDWLDRQRTSTLDPFESKGIQFLSFDRVPITLLWDSGAGRFAAFVAGPRYLKTHWLAVVQKAASPARAYLFGADGKSVLGDVVLSTEDRRVQRTAADTGLPWSVVVTGSNANSGDGEFAARRRTLLAGLAALLIFIAAGSYFIGRSVKSELEVARLQSDFVSAVSHEFRTPLTALRQFNELLQEDQHDSLPPQKRRDYYQAQTRATERLHRLVNSLLDFGRMEAGKRPYRFERLDAAALVNDVVQDFCDELEGRGFTVECSTDSEACRVEADSEALACAVWNLLDNAVKYSGSGREVEATVRRTNSSVVITVRDHGIGIPIAEQQQIFQKFMRGAEAKSRGIAGTGIGLAMAQRIVNAHGGRLTVQSTLGTGSAFTILLRAKE